MDAVLTIAPRLAASSGRAAAQTRIVPLRLTSTTCANASGPCSSARRMVPAQLTTMSSRASAPTSPATAVPSVTSSCRRSAWASTASSRAASSSGSNAPVAVTSAPDRRKARATAAPMPDVPPVTRTRAPAKRSGAKVRATASADELVDIVRPQPDLGIVPAAHVDLGEHVLEAAVPVLLVEVVHAARDVEEGHHLLAVLGHPERVDLAWRLEDVGAGLRHPLVLEVLPAAAQDEAVDRVGVEVAREDAGLADAQQVAPLAGQRVEHQRPEPDVRRLRHPDPLVLRHGADRDLLGRQPVRRPRHVGVEASHSPFLYAAGGRIAGRPLIVGQLAATCTFSVPI